MKIASPFLFLLLAPMAEVFAQMIPLSLGPDFQRPFSKDDILRGFKLNVAEGEDELKQNVFDAEIQAIPFSTSYTNSRVIKSTDELREMMEIDGHLSVSYGPVSGEGAGRYFENTVTSRNQATIVYRTRRVAYAKSAKVQTLRPRRQVQNMNRNQIAEEFGTKFIDQIVYGAQLDVIFTVTSTEDIDIQEIEAELKGKIGIGKLSVGFQAKFEKQSGSSRAELEMSIVAQASGVDFATPSNPTFDQVNELIDQFNARYDVLLDATKEGETVDTESNVLKQLSPVGFTVSSIADYLGKMDKLEAALLDSRMGDLEEVFSESLHWKATLKRTRDQVERVYGSDPKSREEIFEPYNEAVDKELALLDDKLEECLFYRRLPLQEIVGKNPAQVPELYPQGYDEDVLHGLIGEAFIPSPLSIGESTFDDFHYIGFALPDGEVQIPWMSGMVRRNGDDSIVATAETPEDLENLVKMNLSNKQVVEKSEWGPYLNKYRQSPLNVRWDNRPKKALCGMSSEFSTSDKDRRFRFKTCTMGNSTHIGSSWEMPPESEFAKGQKAECSGNRVLTQLLSYFHGHHKDRKFLYGCNAFHGWEKEEETCHWIDHRVNYYGEYFGFECADQYVLTGVQSVFDKTQKDRRFKFQCCRMKPNKDPVQRSRAMLRGGNAE